MTATEFLSLANRLAGGPSEAEWRTAISRAYYASFHVARELLENLGFRVPRADRAHAYLILRLGNCGDPQVQSAASDLQVLRVLRNQADYDLHRTVAQTSAVAQVQMAEGIIRLLDTGRADPTRTQITDTMRVYERDILRDLTWQQP